MASDAIDASEPINARISNIGAALGFVLQKTIVVTVQYQRNFGSKNIVGSYIRIAPGKRGPDAPSPLLRVSFRSCGPRSLLIRATNAIFAPMPKRAVSSSRVYKSSLPFAQATVAGGFMFVCCVGCDRDGSLAAGDVRAQTQQALDNADRGGRHHGRRRQMHGLRHRPHGPAATVGWVERQRNPSLHGPIKRWVSPRSTHPTQHKYPPASPPTPADRARSSPASRRA
jgi:enamine deaminase RidA (YjgF/YER057c/UK114 family)